MSFYRIAGLDVSMHTSGKTQRQATAWLAEPDDYSRMEPIRICTGADRGDTSEEVDVLEYQRTESAFNRALLEFDGILLHSSAICYQGKAYCFAGSKGVGKSTHTGLWQRVYGEDEVTIINDDKPAVRFVDGAWYVYGTPWSGKTDKARNIRRPLGGIVLLRQWDHNQCDRVTTSYSITKLTACLSGPLSGVERWKAIGILGRIIKDIPIWSLSCLPDEEAVMMAHDCIIAEGGTI